MKHKCEKSEENKTLIEFESLYAGSGKMVGKAWSAEDTVTGDILGPIIYCPYCGEELEGIE